MAIAWVAATRASCSLTSRRPIGRQREAVVQDLDSQLGQLYPDLEGYNADFQALEQLEKHRSLFTENELDDLKYLFGWYGLETDKRLPPGKVAIEYAAERQQRTG